MRRALSGRWSSLAAPLVRRRCHRRPAPGQGPPERRPPPPGSLAWPSSPSPSVVFYRARVVAERRARRPEKVLAGMPGGKCEASPLPEGRSRKQARQKLEEEIEQRRGKRGNEQRSRSPGSAL